MEISNNVTITVSVMTLITVFGVVTKLIYNYARMELKQEYMEKHLNAAHSEIKEMKKKPTT